MKDLGFYQSKRILVTGGTGSIGSQVVEQLLVAGADVVRIISRDETRQLEFQEKLAENWGSQSCTFLDWRCQGFRAPEACHGRY